MSVKHTQPTKIKKYQENSWNYPNMMRDYLATHIRKATPVHITDDDI